MREVAIVAAGMTNFGELWQSSLRRLFVDAASEALERLHLDHERPLHQACRWWRERLPAAPRAWDDGLDGERLPAAPRAWDNGLDGAALCHDLFGVCDSEWHGAAFVRFWCGPPRDASGARVQFVDHAYCHRA